MDVYGLFGISITSSECYVRTVDSASHYLTEIASLSTGTLNTDLKSQLLPLVLPRKKPVVRIQSAELPVFEVKSYIKVLEG
jgi:hypothetical protein